METKTLTGARATVLSCIEALNDGDYKNARSFLAENMRFTGVLGSRDGADAYMKDMRKMQLKYDVKMSFEEGEDVCLFYDLKISGTTIFGCGWYHVKNGKINTLKVVFDPRPVIEKEK